jgi:rhomboid family protein
MLPLRDSIPSRRPPYVTYSIVGLCVAVYIGQLLSPDSLVEWALVPQRLVNPAAWGKYGIVHVFGSLITSQFLHGDPLHLGFNMLFLWVFGDNVEDRLGRGGFVAFYLLCGVIAGLAQSVLTWFPDVPMIGASGAIAGVLGAYFVLFRTAWIRSLVLLFVFPIFVEIPAVVFIGIWFVLQTLNALVTIGPVPAHGGAGVAFAAHASGFLAGIGLLRIFSQPKRPPRVRVVRFEVD